MVFLTKRETADIVAGAPWEEVLYHSLRCCRAVGTLCSSRSNASQWCFAEARAQADGPLARMAQDYYGLDVKGLALCGLVLCGDRENLPGAIEAYQAAQAINKDAGVVGRFLRLLDALALAAPDGVEALTAARAIKSGSYRAQALTVPGHAERAWGYSFS